MTLVSTSPSTAEYLAMATQPEEVSGVKEASRSPQNGIASVRGASPVATADVGNDLMLALQRGDRPSLDRLFSLYNGKLYSFIVRIVGDASTAEDIVQETWLTLYERRSSYQPTFKFSTWLFTIARRKALSELRRRSVRSVVRSLTAPSRGGDGGG